MARAKVEKVIGKWRGRPVPSSSSSGNDTKVWPLVQMGQLGVEYDKQATAALLSYEGAKEVKLATGYFNLTDEYKECVLGNEKTTFDVLMAHPRANGFFNASGMSGGVTPAYTLLANQFFDRCGKYALPC
jgi:CDP-diacylglycerol--glycerol-3-phosphate 3-phosphatidyltransferase